MCPGVLITIDIGHSQMFISYLQTDLSLFYVGYLYHALQIMGSYDTITGRYARWEGGGGGVTDMRSTTILLSLCMRRSRPEGSL